MSGKSVFILIFDAFLSNRINEIFEDKSLLNAKEDAVLNQD